MIRMVCSLLLVVCSSFSVTWAAEVNAEKNAGGVAITIDGKPFTQYLTLSGSKPVLWPIIGPTGKAMTRAYPMGSLDGEKTDHVHHRSLWFTHGAVEGIDFWLEGAKGGRIVHRDFSQVESGPQAVVATVNDWISPDGKKICEDERRLTFGTDGEARFIDFEITIKASEGDVTFGDTKEGTFGVRVAETMKVDAKKGGRIINSEGQTDGDAWGKPAAWVDYFGPVEGETVGVAILNHPSSFRFPTHWHVRTYGLFAANPFGLNDFKQGKDGAHTIKAGETMKLSYRVLLHAGDHRAANIADAFTRYAELKIAER